MAGTLKGSPELKARLKAIKQTFRPYGRKWATATTKRARSGARFQDRTGKGRRSIRVKSASQKRATVVANYYVAILDRGNKQYTITPRRAANLVFTGSDGRTVFTKKVTRRARSGMGFGKRAADAALKDVPMAAELIRQWNDAA
jgi:hypothetical protein